MKNSVKKLLFSLTAVASFTAYSTDLRMISSYHTTGVYAQEIAQRYINNVEKASKGSTKISLDGPGVISPFEQLQPVAAGVYDLLYTHGAYHTNVTGVGAAMDAVFVNPKKTRTSGLWALIDEHYNGLGLKLIAIVPLGSSGFQYILKDSIDGEPGLKGRKMRGSPTYTNVTKGLGGTPVLMSSGDVYSALDRGVIDGAAWGLNGVEKLGWHEVAGYFSKPTFGQTYTYLLMNKNAFDKLESSEQQILLTEAEQLELEIVPILDKLAKAEWKSLEGKGMAATEFKPSDAKKLDALVNAGIWKLGIDKTPETVKKMRIIAIENNMTPQDQAK